MKCPLSVSGGEDALIAHLTRRDRGELMARTAAHIRHCEGCSAWVRSQSTLWQTLDDWRTPPVSLDFDQTVLRRAAELKALPTPWWVVTNGWFTELLTRPAAALSFGAMILVIGTALVSLPHSLPLAPTPGSQAREAGRIQTVTPMDAEQLDKTFDDLQLLQQLDVKDEGSVDSRAI